MSKQVILTTVTLLTLVSSGNKAVAADLLSNTHRALQRAVDLGPVDPAEEITITVHLNKANQEVLDKTVEALYEPGSPVYERWLTDSELRAYAPSPAAVAAVKAELVKNGLKVLSIDPLGFSVRARGAIANVQKAFQTEVHQYSLNKYTFRHVSSAATLTGGASRYVHVVTGLEGAKVQPLALQATNPKTGKSPLALL